MYAQHVSGEAGNFLRVLDRNPKERNYQRQGRFKGVAEALNYQIGPPPKPAAVAPKESEDLPELGPGKIRV
jgi:hypothetical protein